MIDFQTEKDKLERKKAEAFDKNGGIKFFQEIAECFVQDVNIVDAEALVAIRHKDGISIYDGITDEHSIIAITFRLLDEHPRCVDIILEHLNKIKAESKERTTH